MLATQLAAYKKVQMSDMSGREIEASVLTRAANLLEGCQRRWDAEGHFQRLDEALRFNQKIWTIFQLELAQETTPLPKEIRINILRLSIFLDRRILEVMANPSPEKLKIIIDINRNIAAGLRNSQPVREEAAS